MAFVKPNHRHMNKNVSAQANILKEERKQFAKKIPGQSDFLPEDFADLEHIFSRLDSLARSFGFTRVEPSLFESGGLHEGFLSQDSKPVTFTLGNGSIVALRAAVLPSILRMYLESRVYEREPVSKWYFLTSTTTQKQNPEQLVSNLEYGFEILGDESAISDAQVLALAWKLYDGLNSQVSLEIGSRGCEICWPEYQETLRAALSDVKYSLCKDCALSLNKNPERVLTCEQSECQSIAADVPAFIDYLDPNCAGHLTTVLESLDELGVPYTLLTTVPAQPFTKRTIFKFKFNHPQDSFILSEGHRHDKLFGPYKESPRPALGISGDLGRLLRAWRLAGLTSDKGKTDVVLIPLGELACKKTLPLFSKFWDSQIRVINLMGENSLKSRLQQAVDMKALIALVVGQKEALDGTVILRDVRSGMQEVFPVERILDEVRKRLGE